MAKRLTILILLFALHSEAATVFMTRDNERCGIMSSQAPSTWNTVVGTSPVAANWDLDGDELVTGVGEYSKHLILTYKITPNEIPVGSAISKATFASWVTGLVQGTSLKFNKVIMTSPDTVFRPTWFAKNSITKLDWSDPEEFHYNWIAMHDQYLDIDHDIGGIWEAGKSTDVEDQNVVNVVLNRFLPEIMPGSDLYLCILITNTSATGWASFQLPVVRIDYEPSVILPTPTPTITYTPTQTGTNTSTPTRTPTASFTVTNTPTNTGTIPTPTPSNTSTATPTKTSTRTRTFTQTFTNTFSFTPTVTPTFTGTPPTPTVTNTRTFTRTFTNTYTVTPTFTGASPTPTRTPTLTYTRTNTATFTGTRTYTPLPTVTQTRTNTTGPSPTLTRTWTITLTPTVIPTPTVTRTNTTGPSPTPTVTGTSTATPTVSPTRTQSPTPTGELPNVLISGSKGLPDVGPGYIEKLVVGELIANNATLLDANISASAISMGGTFLNAALAQVGDTQLNSTSQLDVNGLGNFGNIIIDSENKSITITDPDNGASYPGHGGNLEFASQPMFGSISYEDVTMLEFSNSALAAALAAVTVQVPLVTDRIYIGGSGYGGLYLEGTGGGVPQLTLGYFLTTGFPAPEQLFQVEMDTTITEDLSVASIFFVNDTSTYDAVGIGMSGGGGTNARLRVRANDTNTIGTYSDSVTASGDTNIGVKCYASGGTTNYGLWADGTEYAAYLEGPLAMKYTNPQIDFNNSDSIRYTDSSAVFDFYNGSQALFSINGNDGTVINKDSSGTVIVTLDPDGTTRLSIGGVNAQKCIYTAVSGTYAGTSYGGHFVNTTSTASQLQIGVHGDVSGSTATSNIRYGIYGTATNGMNNTIGVYGVASGSAGSGYLAGVRGANTMTVNTTKYGSYGTASGANGTNVGAFGNGTGAPANRGVFGTATGSTGAGAAGYFDNTQTTTSTDQYAIYASVSGTEAGSTHYGVRANASGGAVNWAISAGVGDVQINDTLNLGAGSALTISGNAVTATKSRHSITASGASDTLNTINGGTNGDILRLSGTAGKTITVADGAGNIQCNTNRTLDGTNDYMLLMYDGTNWQMLGIALDN